MLHVHLAAPALVLALVVAGCGGSSKSSSQTTPVAQTTSSTSTAQTTPATQTGTSTQTSQVSSGKPLGQAELAAAANAICGRIRTHLSHNRFKTQKEIGAAAPGISAYEHASLLEMEKLVPPASLASDWKQILDGVKTLSSDAATIGVYARADRLETPAGRSMLVVTGQHGTVAASIARRDGMEQCAEAV